MALAHGVVIEVVGWRDLYAARAKTRVDVVIGNDWDFPSHQRQQNLFTDQVLVALVLGMHGHGLVTQHGLGSGGGHHETAFSIGQGVAQLPEMAVFFLADHFKV